MIARRLHTSALFWAMAFAGGIVLVRYVGMLLTALWVRACYASGSMGANMVSKWTRSAVYLCETVVLLGFIWFWRAVLSLAFLPIFITAIDTRRIAPKKDRLRRKFRSDFERYMRNTRRWI